MLLTFPTRAVASSAFYHTYSVNTNSSWKEGICEWKEHLNTFNKNSTYFILM